MAPLKDSIIILKEMQGRFLRFVRSRKAREWKRIEETFPSRQAARIDTGVVERIK
jgi:hypothetical protein